MPRQTRQALLEEVEEYRAKLEEIRDEIDAILGDDVDEANEELEEELEEE